MDDFTRPHWKTSASITIDTQIDWSLADGSIFVPGTPEVIPRMSALLAAFRQHHRPIVHVVRLYLPDGSNADLCRKALVLQGRSIVAPGSPGAELVADLLPAADIRLAADALLAGEMQKIADNEWIVYKSRFGAFFQTPLEEHLQGLGVDTLVFTGCNFPNCPRTSIYEASERDFRLVVIQDAISGIYPQGEKELKGIGVYLIPHDRCIQELAAAFSSGD